MPAVLACLLAAACSEEAPVGPPQVAEISITPATTTVPVGDALVLTASPKDQAGKAIPGPVVVWTSVNSAVASVTLAGSVTTSAVVRGVSEGTTDISAIVSGTMKTVAITVTPPRIETIDVRPLTGQVLVGATIQMTATPRSTSGLPLAGRTFQWTSSDTTRAKVSASGLVTGVSGGDVTITATADQRSGAADLLVLDPTAPRISSITPFPLVEGQPGTVTGINFGVTAGDNAVTVDGVAAVVTAGSSTSITFTVPATGCRPFRSVPVRVTAGGKAGILTQPLRPASFTQLAVGEQVVLSGAATACIQLQATSAEERYLVGVQSVSETPANVMQLRLGVQTGIADGGPGTLAPAVTAALEPWPTAPAAWTASPDDAAARLLAAQRVRHLEARQGESLLLSSGLDFATAAAGALQSPIPPDATVGQRFAVKVPPHYPGSCTQFTTIQAELRRITPRGHWLVDVSNLASTYTSAELQSISDEIEGDVLPALEPVFGAVPDTDADPRIAFVISSKVNGEGWLSYPSLFDYLPASECPASNQGDFLYVATPQSGGFSAPLLVSVMGFSAAHDLTHVIQNRAPIAGRPRAPAWIEEGQAGIGEEIYAHRVTGQRSRQNYGASVIFSRVGEVSPYSIVGSLAFYFGYEDGSSPKIPDAPELCTWLSPQDGDATPDSGPCVPPGPSAGAWAFLRWLTDHYGTAVGGDGVLHQGLIDASGPGFARVENLVGVPIETLLARFGATLYADDRVVPLEPTLDFPSWNLLDFDDAVFSNARLVPKPRGFAKLTETAAVRAASTLYYEFSGPGRPATAIEVSGPTGAALSPLAQVWVVRMK